MSLESLPRNVIMYMFDFLYPEDLKTVRFVSTHYKDVGMIVLAKNSIFNTTHWRKPREDFLKIYGRYFNAFCGNHILLQHWSQYFKNATKLCLHSLQDVSDLKMIPVGIKTLRIRFELSNFITEFLNSMWRDTRVDTLELTVSGQVMLFPNPFTGNHICWGLLQKSSNSKSNYVIDDITYLLKRRKKCL